MFFVNILTLQLVLSLITASGYVLRLAFINDFFAAYLSSKDSITKDFSIS